MIASFLHSPLDLFYEPLFEQVRKDHDDTGVDKVNEQGTNQRYAEESARGRTMNGRNSTHVGHCVRRCAHPEAADSGNFDGSIVIAAHSVEYDKVGEQGHEDNLGYSDDGERTSDIEEFPNAQTHKGHGQEDVEANITHGLDFRNWHIKARGMVSRVAKNGSNQHGEIGRAHV